MSVTYRYLGRRAVKAYKAAAKAATEYDRAVRALAQEAGKSEELPPLVRDPDSNDIYGIDWADGRPILKHVGTLPS